MPVDADAAPTADEQEDDSMAIDEEGRPRFAPSRDIVRMPITRYSGFIMGINLSISRIP